MNISKNWTTDESVEHLGRYSVSNNDSYQVFRSRWMNILDNQRREMFSVNRFFPNLMIFYQFCLTMGNSSIHLFIYLFCQCNWILFPSVRNFSVLKIQVLMVRNEVRIGFEVVLCGRKRRNILPGSISHSDCSIPANFRLHGIYVRKTLEKTGFEIK